MPKNNQGWFLGARVDGLYGSDYFSEPSSFLRDIDASLRFYGALFGWDFVPGTNWVSLMQDGVSRSKRLILLKWLADQFEPGRRYRRKARGRT